jgi:hypothetical protein
MIYLCRTSVLFAALFVVQIRAQELRGAQSAHGDRKLNGLFDWFGGWFGNGNDSNNNGGFISDIWDGIFGDKTNNTKSNSSDSLTSIVNDILDVNDGSHPVGDAFNATINSETPLTDFLAELLDQPNSEQPVQDFIAEAFNRTDVSLLDFIADLFNTTSKPIASFVSDLINGSTSPLQDAVQEWFGGEVFSKLDCPAAGPPCAYNLDGTAGIWVCRTLYSPFNGTSTSSTLCANPDFGLPQNDKCGACSAAYPTPCTCPCSLAGTGDGVKVSMKNVFTGRTEEQCVNAAWATGALDRFGIKCVTGC